MVNMNGGGRLEDPFQFDAETMNNLLSGGGVLKRSALTVEFFSRRAIFGRIEQLWPQTTIDLETAIADPVPDGVYYLILEVEEYESGVTETPTIKTLSDLPRGNFINIARITVLNEDIQTIEQCNYFQSFQIRDINISQSDLVVELDSDVRKKLEFTEQPSILNRLDLPSSGQDPWWNEDSDVFSPDKYNDAYTIRVSATATPASNNRTLFCSLDIGGSQGEIVKNSSRLTRGASVSTQISFVFPVFVKQTFVDNGASIYFECDSDCDLSDISIYIIKAKGGFNL